jgi:hypothetical protein
MIAGQGRSRPGAARCPERNRRNGRLERRRAPVAVLVCRQLSPSGCVAVRRYLVDVVHSSSRRGNKVNTFRGVSSTPTSRAA